MKQPKLCPRCQLVLVRRYDMKDHRQVWRCPEAGCDYQVPMEEDAAIRDMGEWPLL
jgi:transposase-like protein